MPRIVFLLAIAAGLVSIGSPVALEAADPVESGREALGSSWNYPWYDGQSDSLRRLPLRDPWSNSSRKTNWSWAHLGLQYAAWIAGAAVLATIAYLLLRFFRENSGAALDQARPQRAALDRARIEALPFAVANSAEELLDRCRRLRAEGNYAAAIVCLFSFELLELDRRQVIHLARGKTNRQYLREAARRSPLAGALERCMVAFEDAFFGHQALDRQRFEACWSQLDEFTVGGGGAA
ncbi:MAG TPA: DUF4129 domain-containing protein [Pirellulales bacterium]|jgi:hypothetical protein|nr:DUF4129 domain-containing protein [Pirellulales bacterium]